MTGPDRHARRRAPPWRSAPGRLQAAYYLLTGAWPLVTYRSFEAISGRKREPWLVRMVGLLTVVIGAVLLADARDGSRHTMGLGVGSAMAYTAIDVWYAGVRRRISPVYLLDALVEVGLVALWFANLRRSETT